MSDSEYAPAIKNPREVEVKKIARQIWRTHPEMLVQEMLEHESIKNGCLGMFCDRKKKLDWISPNAKPQDEFERFRRQGLWKVADAAALWNDVNPFIYSQIRQKYEPRFWEFQCSVVSVDDMLEMASISIVEKVLSITTSGDDTYVKPQDFYNWAINHTDGPTGSAADFFAELKEEWSKIPVPPEKPPTKVEEKQKEISRILGEIKAADPEFNSASMPGRKEDFQKLCIQMNKQLFSIAQSTFNDYLPNLCTFKAGARETDYYTKIAVKLGGN